jgi:hypothetical protein
MLHASGEGVLPCSRDRTGRAQPLRGQAQPPAAAHIARAYAAAHLPPPSLIVCCGGPVEIAEQLAKAPVSASIGRSVKDDVFDVVQERSSAVGEIFYKDALRAALDRDARERLGDEAVEQAVKGAVDALLLRPSPRMKEIARRVRRLPRLLARTGFDAMAVGPAQLRSIAALAGVMAGADGDDGPLHPNGIREIAARFGWIVPYENVCWVAERPETLKTDAQGRLHCPDGPALRYPDGWCVWAWKGVEVPAWAILHPERITLSTLDDELDPLVRHSLIEIMTPERLIASGAARCLSRDATGVLWGMAWTHRGVMLDAWRAVEVVDGTPSADGNHRRYVIPVPGKMRSAREAVAWTYGLTADQYATLRVRT